MVKFAKYGEALDNFLSDVWKMYVSSLALLMIFLNQSFRFKFLLSEMLASRAEVAFWGVIKKCFYIHKTTYYQFCILDSTLGMIDLMQWHVQIGSYEGPKKLKLQTTQKISLAVTRAHFTFFVVSIHKIFNTINANDFSTCDLFINFPDTIFLNYFR